MKRFKPFYKNGKMSRLLFEQEEDLFATEEEGGEEAEEGGEEAEEAEEGDAEGETDEAAEEEEAEEEVPEEAKLKLGKVIDDDLEALLVDFETEARQSKKIEKEDRVEESLSLSRLLFESEYDEEIDLNRFTSELARLIKNYDTLLDMEDMILSKAKSFIIARYGEAAAAEMENSLADNHDIEVIVPTPKPASDQEAPIAVGAAAGGAVGE